MPTVNQFTDKLIFKILIILIEILTFYISLK